MTQRRGPDGLAWSDVIRLAIGARLASTHVAFPARVEAYDAARNSVDVLPQLERETECINGDALRERLPIVPSVPIAWPRSRGYGITFPLEVGDFVLVVCCDRNIGEWLRLGEAGDPRDAGMHGLDGAVAIPGLYPDADALDPAAPLPVLTDHLVVGAMGGGPTIHIDEDEIRLGSNLASDYVALASKVEAQFTRLKSAIENAATTLNDGGAAFKANIVAALNGVAPPGPSFPESVAAEKVKGE